MIVYKTSLPWPQSSTQKLQNTLQQLPKSIQYRFAQDKYQHDYLLHRQKPSWLRSTRQIIERMFSALAFRMIQGLLRLKAMAPGKSMFRSLQLMLQSREHLLRDIGRLKRDIPSPYHPPMPLEDLSRRQLRRVRTTLSGLIQMQEARSWLDMKKGLEQFLDLTGANLSQNNCGPIALTHAQRLATGEYASALPYFNAWVGNDAKSFRRFLQPLEFIQARPGERQRMLPGLRQDFLALYGLDPAKVKHTTDIREIERCLLKEGSGAQALIFDKRFLPDGKRQGHASLAVNLKGSVFHINSSPVKSAVVSPLRVWGLYFTSLHLQRSPFHPLEQPLPEDKGNFYYGILKSRVMDHIASGKPLNETTQKKGGSENKVQR